FVAAWRLRSGDPFTEINSMKKFVASRGAPQRLEWNATRLEGDTVAVKGLKQEQGNDVLICGSGALGRSLMPHGLIDSYRVVVYPLMLGEGKRFVDGETKAMELALLSTATTQKGVTLLTYGRRGS